MILDTRNSRRLASLRLTACLTHVLVLMSADATHSLKRYLGKHLNISVITGGNVFCWKWMLILLIMDVNGSNGINQNKKVWPKSSNILLSPEGRQD